MKFITVKWLIRHNACSEGVCSFTDKFGKTALVGEVINWLRKIKKPEWEGWLMAQEIEMIKVMLENGADIHAFKDFALQLASENGRLKVIKFLLENGADIHAYKDFSLQCAVSNGDLKTTKFLLENGANIHAMDDCVIKSAVENNDLKMIKLLFENGADIHADRDYIILWAKRQEYKRIMSFLKKAIIK
jgi:ankyrin repeat protein